MKVSKTALISLATGFLSLGAISCATTNGKNTASDYSYGNGGAGTDVEFNTVHFDFDRYDIRSDQRVKADAMARSLKENPNIHVQIQGNTDDRGSVEYNMALGTRRAESLKKYFVASGVNSDNIDVVSYGKERPAVQGENESAWAQNRRDDVVEID